VVCGSEIGFSCRVIRGRRFAALNIFSEVQRCLCRGYPEALHEIPAIGQAAPSKAAIKIDQSEQNFGMKHRKNFGMTKVDRAVRPNKAYLSML
jgi:hypothetical protein